MDIVSANGYCFIVIAMLTSTRNNDIDGIIELSFAVDDEKFGEHETIDLIPGGRDITVTNENKAKYVE